MFAIPFFGPLFLILFFLKHLFKSNFKFLFLSKIFKSHRNSVFMKFIVRIDQLFMLQEIILKPID